MRQFSVSQTCFLCGLHVLHRFAIEQLLENLILKVIIIPTTCQISYMYFNKLDDDFVNDKTKTQRFKLTS